MDQKFGHLHLIYGANLIQGANMLSESMVVGKVHARLKIFTSYLTCQRARLNKKYNTCHYQVIRILPHE